MNIALSSTTNSPISLMAEFDFILPRGLIDSEGQVHRQGRMRLAIARDELIAQKDRRVQKYPDYAELVLLSQVITQLGTLARITPEHLEHLFSLDLAYLREIYNRLNQTGHLYVPTQCPHCDAQFEVELDAPGES